MLMNRAIRVSPLLNNINDIVFYLNIPIKHNYAGNIQVQVIFKCFNRGCHRILPFDDQTSLSERETKDLSVLEMENEDPLTIELRKELAQDRKKFIKEKYRDSLFSSGVQLRERLYGQIV